MKRLEIDTVDQSKLLEQKVSARRRLIRGAFVAPVALTLFSGSAFAQASMTCVSKRVADPVLPLDSGIPVVYLRVPLWGLGSSTWIKGAEVVDLLRYGKESVTSSLTSFLPEDKWLCVSNGKGAPNGSWEVGTPYADPKLNGSVPKKLMPEQYAAVRVDADGNIVGIVGIGNQSGSSAVGWDSCWASFAGVTRFA